MLTGVVWLLSFVNGAIVWEFVFGQTYSFLPGNTPWSRASTRRLRLAGLMGVLFFPLVDRGIFSAKLGLGIAPAMLLLGALLAYSVTMSLVYSFLEGPRTNR